MPVRLRSTRRKAADDFDVELPRSKLERGNRMSVKVDPFDSRYLPELIRSVLAEETVNVITHESSTKEFKENFTWDSLGLYARTMAAYANARGGYIIFGVTDKPRQLVGLRSKSLTRFDNLDQAKGLPVNKPVFRVWGFIVVLSPLAQRLRRRCGRSSIRCGRIWTSVNVV